MNEFGYCPQCASTRIITAEGSHWVCPDCGYDLYNNTAAAVGLLITIGTKLLMFTRTKNPSKGKYGIPGGFVNPGETLEAACYRECAEEIGITLPAFSYLCSFPNVYPYKTVTYCTCDIFFHAVYEGTAEELLSSITTVDGEASNCTMKDMYEINPDTIAFESMKLALAELKKHI